MGWVAEMLTYNTCTWEAEAELFKASLTQLETPCSLRKQSKQNTQGLLKDVRY